MRGSIQNLLAYVEAGMSEESRVMQEVFVLLCKKQIIGGCI